MQRLRPTDCGRAVGEGQGRGRGCCATQGAMQDYDQNYGDEDYGDAVDIGDVKGGKDTNHMSNTFCA